ncbi:protein kinase [Actinoplanes sp. NPDC024001]|uniref:serine/threonine-protein kinase n=1 Tax=Actinoplanes sp. NPDC024001 TaxID=3154598 RepID=UPI00340B4449
MSADVVLRAGLRLGGRYHLQQRLGAGGMGEVWLAVDEVLRRTVAVKAMLPGMADDPDFAKRFAGEATAMARVNHPAVASIHDYGRSDGVAFLVMEFVDGESLAQRLARAGRLRPDETMRLVAQVADGLQAVHDQGLVHRDIKPANLLVRRDGTVVITDFGIARHEDASRLTVSGAILGTPTYLSPEQVRGEPAEPRSDVYSLGLVAYECLAGARPFTGDNPYAVALQRLQSAPRTIGVGLPGPVSAVVERALAVELEGRWPSAAALAAAARAAAAPPSAAAPDGSVTPGHPAGFAPGTTVPGAAAHPAGFVPEPPAPGAHGDSAGSASGATWSSAPGYPAGFAPGPLSPGASGHPAGFVSRVDPSGGIGAASSGAPGNAAAAAFPVAGGAASGGPAAIPGAPGYPVPAAGAVPSAGGRSRRTALLAALTAAVLVAGGVFAWSQMRPTDDGRKSGGAAEAASGGQPGGSTGAGSDGKPGESTGAAPEPVAAGFVACGQALCPVEPLCWAGLTVSSGRAESPRPVDCAEPHFWETFLAVPMPAGGVKMTDEPLLERAGLTGTCSAQVMTDRSRKPQRTRSWKREAWPVEVGGETLLHCLGAPELGEATGAVFRAGP